MLCEDIIEILNEYKIKYKNTPNMGEVDLGSQEIYINPGYNKDVETLAHEFMHIWYEQELEQPSVSEYYIEKESQELIKDKDMYDCLDNYLIHRTWGQRL